MHSVHFHGQILTAQNHHTDTISLFPASTTTAEMVADNPGHWLLTCTVNDHLMGELTSPFCHPVGFKVFHLSSIVCVCGFVQLECRLYLRSRSVSPTSINPDHTASSDSSSLLLRKMSGTMPLRCLMIGWLLYTHKQTHTHTNIFTERLLAGLDVSLRHFSH